MKSIQRAATKASPIAGQTLSAGDAILQIMRDYGVTDIFSSPGSDWPAIWESLAKRRAHDEPLPRYFNCRDETQAVSMAIGYYKATARMPAVMLHTGVGVLHGAMALRAGMRSFVPMLVLAGESDSFGEDPRVDPGVQWLDQLADVGGPDTLARPYVKWAARVPSPIALPMTLSHACRLALAPPAGPVVVTVSMENSFASVPSEHMPTIAAVSSHTRPDPDAVAQVATMLGNSTRPVMVTERVGEDPSNVARVVALAEEMAIPVVDSRRTAVNMPDDHPLHLGHDVNAACQGADLIMLVGCRTPWHPASAEPAPNAKIIVLDEEPRAQLPMWHYRTDLFVHGTLSATLDDLLATLRASGATTDTSRMKERLAQGQDMHDAVQRSYREKTAVAGDLKTLQDTWVSHVLGDLLPAEAMVVEETITSSPSVAQHVTRTEPGTLVRKFGGGLGIGFGAALGVKVASPDRLVVSLQGDGSFLYSPALACLGFMQEYGTPILIVIYDNQSYSAMRGSLLGYYPAGYAARTGIHYGSDIKPTTDYAGLARLFGGYGELVQEPAQMAAAVQRGLQEVAAGRFVILQALIDEPKYG